LTGLATFRVVGKPEEIRLLPHRRHPTTIADWILSNLL
jgi:hypothetical protein